MADVDQSQQHDVGATVRAGGKVLETYFSKRKGVEPNVCCRVETFGLIVDKFNEMKVKWVNEMGLGHLLNLRCRFLPRRLCYWLMSKVDPIRKVFVGSPGYEYRLEKKQIRWVLGIPLGPNRVPRVGRGNAMKKFMSEAFDKYGVVSSGTQTKYIPMDKVVGVVEGHSDVVDEEQFKVAFLAMSLCDVLCPSTCRRLQKSLIPALTVALLAKDYDWCSLVLEKLIESANRFAIKFEKDGYVKGCGGCSYFLLIFYLDHLNRVPVRWGQFPRTKAWKVDDVKSARDDDKLLDSRDYGRLGCIDVAYGERHPLETRDTAGPRSFAAEVASIVLSGMGMADPIENHDANYFTESDDDDLIGKKRRRKERRRGPNDRSNPYSRKLAKIARQKSVDAGNVETSNHGVSDDCSRLCDDVGAGDDIERSNSIDEDKAYKRGNSDRQETDHTARVKEDVMIEGEGSNDNGGSMNSISSIVRNIFRETQGQCRIGGGSNYLSTAEDVAVEFESDIGCGNLDHRESLLDKEVGDGKRSFSDGELRKGSASRPRRGTKPSATVRDKEFDVSIVPRRHPHLKPKLVKYIRTIGAVIADESCNDGCLKSQEDLALLKCGDLCASISNCYSVVAPFCGRVAVEYVRVAAALYTKMWKRKYGARSSRIMFDPCFGTRVVHGDWSLMDWDLSNAHGRELSNDLRFFVIFVPVEKDCRWWCVAFCFNRSEVWLLDYMSQSPVVDHGPSIDKLCDALDQLLTSHSSSWVCGTLASWPRKSLKMGNVVTCNRRDMVDRESVTVELDLYASGVFMLLGIKACANRITSELFLRSISLEEEGGWVVTDDLMAEENELRDMVKGVLQNLTR